MTEKRIIIDKLELKRIYLELRSKGLSRKAINQEIGGRIDSALYQGYSISLKCFNKLEKLYGKAIIHKVKDSTINYEAAAKGGKKNSGYNFSNDELREFIQIYQKKQSFSLVREYILRKKGLKLNEETIRRRIKKFMNPEDYKKLIEPELNLIKNQALAELVGIILGDGSLSKEWRKKERKYSYRLDISLNRVDEKEYVCYIKDLLMDIFNIEPSVYVDKRSKGISLKYNRKHIIDALVSIGLKTGNKKINQVTVPNWIKSKQEFRIACLKGLIDTDGSIYTVKRRLKINFVNSSFPLVSDFKEMCEGIGIKTTNIHTTIRATLRGKKVRGYDVQIGAKNEVQKFLDIIKPFKWNIKKNDLFKKVNPPFN